MIPLQIVDRYSRSIYELAEEKKQREAVFSELMAVRNAMESRPELLSLLQSPLITRDEKRSLIDGILGPKSSGLAGDFLNLLVRKNRIEYFSDIVCGIKKLTDKRQGVQEALAISARELHPSILQLLQRALEKSTGKKISLRAEENPDLLGGLQIHLGNRLIDGTIRNKLNTLESQLRTVRM